MVNEISFESLRGPITPRRINGRVIFRVSPRKKPGKSFAVWPLQAHAKKMDCRKNEGGAVGLLFRSIRQSFDHSP